MRLVLVLVATMMVATAAFNLDFGQFKASFHKHYGSLIEELVRQKIFLARAVQVFVSVVSYDHLLISSYLMVNQRSDRTRGELQESHLPPNSLFALNFTRQTEYFNVRNDASEAISEPISDELWVDFRRTGCLTPVKLQGDCGSCYAFAALALYEYLYCLSTGQQIVLSEQYLVSCGHRSKLNACRGGRMDHVVDFVDQFGLELASEFPYIAENGTCPYAEEHLGHLRPQRPGFSFIKLENFEKYLSKRRPQRMRAGAMPGGQPIMWGFNIAEDFDFYGGGVDELRADCGLMGSHAMLLIGHGRQDDKEYWLFRNSYGLRWGEQGYYRVSKSALPRCLSSEFGLVLPASFDPV